MFYVCCVFTGGAEILRFRVEILYFRVKFCILGSKFCILGSKFCILATKLEILIKYNFRHYLEIQIPSLPQNTNIVTTSKSKLPQNPNFLTASESEFGRIMKIENSIEIVKFRSKNLYSIQK